MSFSVLVNPKSSEVREGTNFLPTDPVVTGDAPRCPACGNAVGLLPWLPPCRAELDFWGEEPGDIAFGPADELLVSERCRSLYEAAGLTGLSGFHPVKLQRLNRQARHKRLAAPSYFCVYTTRSEAVIDESASGLVRERPATCEECHLGGVIKRTERICLLPGTWSGEDIFVARGLPGVVMASRELAGMIREHRISGPALVDAEACSFDSYPWEK